LRKLKGHAIQPIGIVGKDARALGGLDHWLKGRWVWSIVKGKERQFHSNSFKKLRRVWSFCHKTS
jgi:hypothetical protein